MLSCRLGLAVCLSVPLLVADMRGGPGGAQVYCSVALLTRYKTHSKHTHSTRTGCPHAPIQAAGTHIAYTQHTYWLRAHMLFLATASLCVMFFTLVCYLLRIDCGPVQAFVVLVVSRLRGTSTQPYFQELPDLST